MESDMYFESINVISEKLRNKHVLYPTFEERTAALLAEKLNFIDKDIIATFRNIDVGRKNKQLAFEVANILLSSVIEKQITEETSKFCKECCKVISLWNLKTIKDTDLENTLIAVSQLVNSNLTLNSLLLVMKQIIPQMKQLSRVPLAIDVAGHYLKQMEENKEPNIDHNNTAGRM
jgi:hypothetical protein